MKVEEIEKLLKEQRESKEMIKQLADIVKNLYYYNNHLSETQSENVCNELDEIIRRCDLEVTAPSPVIDLESKPVWVKASNEDIRKALTSTPTHRKPYGTTDGYINSLKDSLIMEGLIIVKETAQQAPVEGNRCFECGELLNKEALFCGECRKQI